jgi:hypothetical protein
MISSLLILGLLHARCGPSFPIDRLMDREATLLHMPDGLFQNEVDETLIKDPTLDEADDATDDAIGDDRDFQLGERARDLLCTAGNHPCDDDKAIALYTLQARLELANEPFVQQGGSGHVSLLLVGRQLLRDAARVERQWRHPRVQRLVALTMWSRSMIDGFDVNDQLAPIWALIERSQQQQQQQQLLTAHSWFAAAAFRAGKFALANQILLNAPPKNDVTAAWVRAKLLLQQGDVAGAETAIRRARGLALDVDIGGEEISESIGVFNAAARLDAERAVLLVHRGDNVGAFRALWNHPRSSWTEVAYVAERLLTTTELRGLVDELTTPVTTNKPAGDGVFDAQQELRLMCMRRLLREGLFAEARAYAPPAHPAHTYAQARIDAAATTDPLVRAGQLFVAHQVLSSGETGIEVLGTEWAPDWRIYQGNYSPPAFIACESEAPSDDMRAYLTAEEFAGYTAAHEDNLRQCAKQQQSRRRWLAQIELDRELDHEIGAPQAPTRRHHYRYLSSDLAAQAAALVPADSQASVALLCHAADPIINRDPRLAQRLYQQYVDHGPLLGDNPFLKSDGCGAPQLEVLRDPHWRKPTLAQRQRTAHLRKWTLRIAACTALLLCSAFCLLHLHKRSTTS